MVTLAVLCAHAVLMIAAVLVVGRKPVQWAVSSLFLAGCFLLEWFAPVDVSWRAVLAFGGMAALFAAISVAVRLAIERGICHLGLRRSAPEIPSDIPKRSIQDDPAFFAAAAAATAAGTYLLLTFKPVLASPLGPYLADVAPVWTRRFVRTRSEPASV